MHALHFRLRVSTTLAGRIAALARSRTFLSDPGSRKLEPVQACRVVRSTSSPVASAAARSSSPRDTSSPRASPITRLPSMALIQCSSGTPMPSELYISLELGATPSACLLKESISP